MVATLVNVNPGIRAGMARVASTWPRELPPDEVLGPRGFAALSHDPLLRCMLKSAAVRDLSLERYLTSLRRIMLDIFSRGTASGGSLGHLELGCALAEQCSVNEYVFASGAQETNQACQL